MPHTRSHGSPEFQLTSPEQILRTRRPELPRDPVGILGVVDLLPIMGDRPPPRRTVHDLASEGVFGARSAITRPGVTNANWQIPSQVMSTITNSTQFHGLEDEDAPGHLSLFVRICDTFRINGVTDEAIYLRLFPFTLAGRAATWLNLLPRDSITTWADLQGKFLKKYYPPSKAARLRDQIHSFRMDDDEPYYMAWERWNALLSRCPQHGLSDWALVEKFYNGLTFEAKQRFNTAAGGHIMNKKEPHECETMFEDFAMAEYEDPASRRRQSSGVRTTTIPPAPTRGVHQVTPTLAQPLH